MLAAGRADLKRCWPPRAAAGPVLERMATHNLGYAQFLGGNLPAALGRWTPPSRLDARSAPRAFALLSMAPVLVEAGLTREAETRRVAEAASIFARDRLAQDLGEAELEPGPGARWRRATGGRPAARGAGPAPVPPPRQRRWRRTADLVLAPGRPRGRAAG